MVDDYLGLAKAMEESYRALSNDMGIDLYNSIDREVWTARFHPMKGRPEWMRTTYNRMITMGVPEEAALKVLHEMELSKGKNRIIHNAAQRRKVMYKKGRSRMPWEK